MQYLCMVLLIHSQNEPWLFVITFDLFLSNSPSEFHELLFVMMVWQWIWLIQGCTDNVHRESILQNTGLNWLFRIIITCPKGRDLRQGTHLFKHPMTKLLKSRECTKLRFLSKADFLFHESVALTKTGQQYIQKFFPSTLTHSDGGGACNLGVTSPNSSSTKSSNQAIQFLPRSLRQWEKDYYQSKLQPPQTSRKNICQTTPWGSVSTLLSAFQHPKSPHLLGWYRVG